jgi:hypothetical protein
MGLAFSELRIVMDTISANPASFLTDLHALLLAARWTAAPYLTGHVYACQSPQELAVQVRIWDPADADFPDCVAFQWVSSVDPFPEGLIHHVYLNAAETCDVWVNCCSLFVARTGQAHEDSFLGFRPLSVCGGIPYAAGLTTPTAQCAAQSPAAAETTAELWFSSGADTGIPMFAQPSLESWRSGHICKRFTFCRNGVLSNAENAIEQDALQLGIFRPPGYSSGGSFVFLPAGIRFTDNTPMAGDPLIWLHGTIYGQLYDACLLSAPMSLGATEEIYESDIDRTTQWTNHSIGATNVPFRGDDGSLFSLLLLTGISGGGTVVENIAY